MTELLTFVSVSAGIQTRRHTKVCQLVCYADHVWHPPPLPLQWKSHRPLHYGQGMCMTVFFIHIYHKKTMYEYYRVLVLLNICIITIFLDSQVSPSLTHLMNIPGNLFDHPALQNHSGYGYGEHQHINIITPEDIPIGLRALLRVYLIFGYVILLCH